MANGFSSDNPVEWLVFIEGYGLTGRVESASELTLKVVQKDEDLTPTLCALWFHLEKQEPNDSLLIAARSSLVEELECGTE